MPAGAPLDQVQLHHVTSLDDAWAAKRWAGQRRDGPLCADTESGGLSPFRHRHRMTQIGDKWHGWAFPPEWFGAANEILAGYRGELCFFNAPYDWLVLAASDGLELPWHKINDALLGGHIVDSVRVAKLKPRAAIEIDPRAMAGEAILDEGMRKQGWTWDTVPGNWEPYWAYGALDPVLTAWLWERFAPQVLGRFRASYDLERATARVCANMMRSGMLIDTPFVERKIREINEFYERGMKWLRDEFWLTTVNSNEQVGAVLNAAGVPTLMWTDGGKPSISKDALKFYAQMFPHAEKLIRTIALCRKAGDLVNKYLMKFLALKGSDDVIHCSIWSSRARTTRMCIPDSHRLLTKRGALSVSDVQPGDETPDMDGKWTTVRAIHRYQNTDTIRYSSNTVHLEATIGHRWVVASDKRPYERTIAPLGSARRVIHLVPSAPSFDFTGTDLRPTFPALIGLLVTDGRCIDEGPGRGMRAMVYQTERKFYRQMARCVPDEARSYDRTTNGADHHEIGIRVRWLRPRLAAAGLEPPAGTVLREHPGLLRWVMTLDEDGVRDFLTAAWLADGTTAHPQNKSISCASAPLRDALQYAGYRLGLRSHVTTQPPSKWSTKDRITVKFTDGVPVHTRFLAQTPARSDVWCVSTDSGTFTAWDDGPYLTGNSITDPPMQTYDRDVPIVRGSFIPRPGNVFITIDADQIEARLAAHASRDQRMIADFIAADAANEKFFILAASKIYGRQISKGDPEYTFTKNATYGQIYGGGLEKIAKTAGVPVQQMSPVYTGFQQLYPGVQRLMNHLISSNRRTGRRPEVSTLGGRRLYADRGHEYALLNYMIQGSAAEILKRGIINLDAAGFGPYLRLPVHDEIVMEVPAGYAGEVLRMATEILTDQNSFAVAITWSGAILRERWVKV